MKVPWWRKGLNGLLGLFGGLGAMFFGLSLLIALFGSSDFPPAAIVLSGVFFVGSLCAFFYSRRTSKKWERSEEREAAKEIQRNPEARQAHFSKQNKESLEQFASSGIKTYEILGSSDSCPYCAKLDGRRFPIEAGLKGLSPVPPFEKCQNDDGCTCTVVAGLNEGGNDSATIPIKKADSSLVTGCGCLMLIAVGYLAYSFATNFSSTPSSRSGSPKDLAPSNEETSVGRVADATRSPEEPIQHTPAPSSGSSDPLLWRSLKAGGSYRITGSFPLMPKHPDNLSGNAMNHIMAAKKVVSGPKGVPIYVRMVKPKGSTPWYLIQVSGEQGWVNGTALIGMKIEKE